MLQFWNVSIRCPKNNIVGILEFRNPAEIRLWKCLKNSRCWRLLQTSVTHFSSNVSKFQWLLHSNSYSGDLLKMTFLGQPAKSNLTIRLWETFIFNVRNAFDNHKNSQSSIIGTFINVILAQYQDKKFQVIWLLGFFINKSLQ